MAQHNGSDSLRRLTVGDMLVKLNCSRRTLYRYEEGLEGFPKRRIFSEEPLVTGWLSDDVDRYLRSRPEA